MYVGLAQQNSICVCLVVRLDSLQEVREGELCEYLNDLVGVLLVDSTHVVGLSSQADQIFVGQHLTDAELVHNTDCPKRCEPDRSIECNGF